MDIEITSINEYVSSTYGKDNIPEDLLEACRVEALYEATKREVQLNVYFKQAFDSLRGKKWTTDKIDKEIEKIEKCNRYIEEAQKKSVLSPKYIKLLTSKTYWEDMVKHGFYIAASSALVDAILARCLILFGARGWGDIFAYGAARTAAKGGAAAYNTVGRMFSIKDDDNGRKHLVMHEKLLQENKKALEWLKKEKERIENGTAKKKKLGDIITGRQESTIFANIEII